VWPSFLYGALAVAALWLVAKAARLFVRITVPEYHRAVHYRRGQFDREVGPGVYWGLRPISRYDLYDLRPQILAVPGQELITSDGLTVKVSLAARWQVNDLRLALSSSATPVLHGFPQQAPATGEIYLELQLGLRQALVGATAEEVLQRRGDWGPAILALKAPRLEAIGIGLISADVKDVMLPAEIRRLMSQVAQAQKEGQARLERARAETATLRHLANAAGMLERNPTLMQLRTLLTIQESQGNSIVLKIDTKPEEGPREQPPSSE
jgi:regulator of protease activity HflC (stomatin/prohibitin superfamily)